MLFSFSNLRNIFQDYSRDPNIYLTKYVYIRFNFNYGKKIEKIDEKMCLLL